MSGIHLDEANVDPSTPQLLKASFGSLDGHRRIPRSMTENGSKSERTGVLHVISEEFPFDSRSGNDHAGEDLGMPQRNERSAISSLRKPQEKAFLRAKPLRLLD
jgi:hypothetical protein